MINFFQEKILMKYLKKKKNLTYLWKKLKIKAFSEWSHPPFPFSQYAILIWSYFYVLNT